MQERVQVTLERVTSDDLADFRQTVDAYWQELMPHADVVKDSARSERFFHKRFTKADDDLHPHWHHPHWAIVEGRKVGFVAFEVAREKKAATVEDFYVAPSERRQGYGAAMVRVLCDHFDQLGVELIELNVRRDNPDALSFWEAQGFRVATFRLRQYRDPKAGVGFLGALSSDFATEDDGQAG